MGIDLNKIPSPCYVIEERLLKNNLELINKVQKEAGIKIILALKGFAMFSTFKIVKKYLETCTASSLNEARLCNEEMKSKAHLYSPVYLENEFDELLKLSSHITFNSLSQWEKFKSKVISNPQKISCGLRINPEYSEVKTDLYNPCIAGSRLGIRAENLGNKLPDGIDGLHFHSLCENNSYALEKTLMSVEEKFSHLLKQAKWLNMGGGHLMTQKDYNVRHLIDLLKNFKNKYTNLEIILEPGGAVGWQTGYLVSTVQDIIDSKGIKVAMLDVSFSAHMPDCLEMPYKPVIHGATDATEGKPTYRMGGITCLAGDYLGDYSFEKPLKEGDKVVFDDMIHYTMVKTTTFNGVAHPSIGIWTEDSKFRLVKKFEYENYRNRLS